MHEVAHTGTHKCAGLWNPSLSASAHVEPIVPILPPAPQSRLQTHAALTIRRTLLLCSLGAAVLLAGCATRPPERSALPVTAIPAGWSTGTGAPDGTLQELAGWWQRFNDAQLTELVTLALQANTDVRTAQINLQQARATRDVQAASLSPRVNGSGSAQRSQQGSAAATDRFQAGLDASWEPDVFGRLGSAVSAAQADTRVAALSLANTQVSVAAEVALTYLDLRGQQARLAIARRNLELQAETQQLTEWRAQAGLLTVLEVEQARAASEQTRAQLPLLLTVITQDQHALAVLTGQAPAALDSRLAAAQNVPRPQDDLALAIPAETLRQRPDVRAAEQRISAALARMSQADAARYPSFSLGGSLGLNALTVAGLSNSAALTTLLLASISVPLFDGGALRAQVRLQEAGLENARVAYQAIVLTALKDVENALVALAGDRERLVRLEAAARSATSAAQLARQRYDSGLIDFQAVLDTQRTQLSAQDSVASTTATLAADHVRLYKALGGGWRTDDTLTSLP